MNCYFFFFDSEIKMHLNNFGVNEKPYRVVEFKLKMMKKLILLSLSIFVYFNVSSATIEFPINLPIVDLHTHDRGLFGYRTTDWEVVSLGGNNNYGWKGSCHDPGLSRCRPPQSGVFDATEIDAIYRCLDIADSEIASKNFNGTDQIRIQVQGEAFERLYIVQWNTNEKGDGSIKVFRENV